jgi:DNA polymerase V
MKAIVDCNSFYCSCERVFRPELNKKPVVVLSNNDGCIISRSDEAKAFGVGMAGPFFMSRHLIQRNNITVFSSNYHLYGDLSWRVMETLRILSNDSKGQQKVEVYSVDEAFIDLDDLPVSELPVFGKHIKDTVEQWTGISVSVGIAPTKTLAKIANHLAKKNKVATGCVTSLANPEDLQKALQRTRVNEIWGVGGAYANKLIRLGITSAWELRNMPEEWAHTHLGGVVGVRLIRELRGEPAIGLREELTSKKMIATTRMFGRPVSELYELKEAVSTYITRAAEKLRRQGSAADTISVFIVPREADHAADFRHGTSISTQMKLESATSFTHELIKPAVQLVESLYERGREYKKAGVMLSGLVPDDSIQGNIFAKAAANRNRWLMSTVDNVNFSMRDDMLQFGSNGINKHWKMRQEFRSPRYSTRWEELQSVS